MAKFMDNFTDLKELGIDCDGTYNSLTVAFDKAASHLPKILPNIDNQTLLELYGYYKQGSEGVCHTPKPSWYDTKAKAKWEAWNRLGDMPENEAKSLYVSIIKKLDPDFDPEDTEEKSKEQWISVSIMKNIEDSLKDSEKNLIDYIKEGSTEDVKKILSKKNVNVNVIDKEGLALVHWAADSGFSDILKVLIEFGADLKAKDAEGQTALHYASSCGHFNCVKLLLENGAEMGEKDIEGNLPADVASDDAIKTLLVSW